MNFILSLLLIPGALALAASVDDDAILVNDEARLLEMLRTRYNGLGLARPVSHITKVLEVSLLFVINEFLGVDELTGTMKVTAAITATWQDDLLRWDPPRFNDLNDVPMLARDVFLPTIVKDGNGGTQSSIFMTGSGQNERDINGMVWVHHTGKVEAKVTGIFLTNCKLNLYNFPFDSQTCNFIFKVWRFNDRAIKLKQEDAQRATELLGSEAASQMTNVNVNPNWLLTSISSEDLTVVGIGENYSAIAYRVICDRRTDYYMWNVLVPTIAMIFLLLTTFFMPFGAERSMFCITLVLTLNIFNQALSTKLPVTAEVIPYVRQMNVLIIVSIFVTIESAAVGWLSNNSSRGAVPKLFYKLVPKLRSRMKERLAMTARRRNSIERVKREAVFGTKARDVLFRGSAGVNKAGFAQQRALSNYNLKHAGSNAGLHSIADDLSISETNLTTMEQQQHMQKNYLHTERAESLSLASAAQVYTQPPPQLHQQVDQISEEDWEQLSDWQEVAQLVDLLALTIVNASVFLLPIIFYRQLL